MENLQVLYDFKFIVCNDNEREKDLTVGRVYQVLAIDWENERFLIPTDIKPLYWIDMISCKIRI
jgi:hypothetical protein